MSALEASVAAVKADNDTLKSRVGAVEADNADLRSRVSDLETKLVGVARSGDTLTFSGMNFQVVNGAGKTDTTNASGNLIIGYNEAGVGGETRTGSHNLIIAPEHTYSSSGGLVAGFDNAIVKPSPSVCGGFFNTASGFGSSVSGGIPTSPAVPVRRCRAGATTPPEASLRRCRAGSLALSADSSTGRLARGSSSSDASVDRPHE